MADANRRAVPPPVQKPGEEPRPRELPGKLPDELPEGGPNGPTTPNPATDRTGDNSIDGLKLVEWI